MGSGNGGELNSRHACAACRHQRKKCDDDCVMAPYFTAEKEEAFRAVHKIFGVSNTSKLLKKLEDKNHRGRAAESFIWEACTWKQDPVNGPLGKYRQLEREIALLRDALQRQQEQEQEEEQEKDCLALPSSTVEQESIALDQGSNNGSDMTYGYANQNLAPANGTYSSLLQGQEVTVRKGLVDNNCVTGSNYQPAAISQGGQQALGQGRQETQRVIGFGPPLMPFDPTIQGGNGRPMRLQGQGRGIAGLDCATNSPMGPNIYGQIRGHVAFDPSQRQFGQVGAAQIGPKFSEGFPGHMRAITQIQDAGFLPYHHHHHLLHHQPIHMQRQGMSQAQNHHSFQQYSFNNHQSYETGQGKCLVRLGMQFWYDYVHFAKFVTIVRV